VPARQKRLVRAGLLAASIAGAGPLARVIAAQSEEWSLDVADAFPGSVPEDAAGRPVLAVTRVVDARTGQPIPGAVMSAVKEARFPVPGPFHSVARAVADLDGWVRLRLENLEPRPEWFFFEGAGFAPAARFGDRLELPIALWPGVDVPIEVRDPLGAPALDVAVELLLGCGHTPSVRTVRADSSGRAVLPGIDPGRGELWPIGAALRSDYVSVDWAGGSDPLVVWCRPAEPIEGIVLDEKGKPVAGSAVGAPRCHRGPWTLTDAEGRFRLLGADRSEALHVHHPRWGEAAAVVTEAPPPGSSRDYSRSCRPTAGCGGPSASLLLLGDSLH
jgi:hypothetical protein